MQRIVYETLRNECAPLLQVLRLSVSDTILCIIRQLIGSKTTKGLHWPAAAIRWEFDHKYPVKKVIVLPMTGQWPVWANLVNQPIAWSPKQIQPFHRHAIDYRNRLRSFPEKTGSAPSALG